VTHDFKEESASPASISNLPTIALPKLPISCDYFFLDTQEKLSYTPNPKKRILITSLLLRRWP